MPEESVVMKLTIYSQVHRNKDSEYLFLGDLTLSRLIACLDQACIEADQFKDPSQPAFLHIEDTIYSQTEEIPRIKASLPSDTRLNFKDITTAKASDVEVSIGTPYLYRHFSKCLAKQHPCDHLFLLSPYRLPTALDKQLLKDGPLQVFGCRNVRSVCEVCEQDFAVVSVVYEQKVSISGESKRQHRTALLCEGCAELFAQEDGARIKMHPYLQEPK
jgi:hypothetical protein